MKHGICLNIDKIRQKQRKQLKINLASSVPQSGFIGNTGTNVIIIIIILERIVIGIPFFFLINCKVRIIHWLN